MKTLKEKYYYYYSNFESNCRDDRGGCYKHPTIRICKSFIRNWSQPHVEILPDYGSIVDVTAQTHTGSRLNPYGDTVAIDCKKARESIDLLNKIMRFNECDYVTLENTLAYLVKNNIKRLVSTTVDNHKTPILRRYVNKKHPEKTSAYIAAIAANII